MTIVVTKKISQIVVNPTQNVIALARGVSNVTLNVTSVSGENLLAYHAVVAINGLLYTADIFDEDHIGRVVGVLKTSALSGAQATYAQIGLVTGASALTPGPLFVGASGVLTSNPDTVGAVWQQQLAIAITATELVVTLNTPFFR